MGRGAGIRFGVTFESLGEITLSSKAPYVKKSNLGLKDGKKIVFTDDIAWPIFSVKMESAESSAEVRSYDNAPIGYALIPAAEISQVVSQGVAESKSQFGPGSVSEVRISDIDLKREFTVSAGWSRSPFPKNGLLDADIEVIVQWEYRTKDGRTHYGEEKITMEGISLFFPNTPGYIKFERWMPMEYDQITVRAAFDTIDELWVENDED